MHIQPAKIKHYADLQLNWPALVPPLRRGRYFVDESSRLSIQGDAPKDFLRIQEYTPGRPGRQRRHWPAYIAKVGSKKYPMESITEQLLTRIGQTFGFAVADSKLLVVAGQVRFLSKFFRGPKESLVHGIEIFGRYLDEEFVDQIAEEKQEREFYAFSTVNDAVFSVYPDHAESIMSKFVEMLAFDAIVGNNDRHHANWGVLVPLSLRIEPRFSPIYDTARGMFWNEGENKVRTVVVNHAAMEFYVNRAHPQIGWDGIPSSDLNHFRLISLIYRDYPGLRPSLERYTASEPIDRCGNVIESEFEKLMTGMRRDAIRLCLKLRHSRYCDAVGGVI